MTIQKLIHQFGFKIYYDLSDRKTLGYLYYGTKKMIVIKKMNVLDERYIIADLLYHFVEEKKTYYEITELVYYPEVISLLIPNHLYRWLPKRYQNEETISKMFQVPKEVAKQKIKTL